MRAPRSTASSCSGRRWARMRSFDRNGSLTLAQRAFAPTTLPTAAKPWPRQPRWWCQQGKILRHASCQSQSRSPSTMRLALNAQAPQGLGFVWLEILHLGHGIALHGGSLHVLRGLVHVHQAPRRSWGWLATTLWAPGWRSAHTSLMMSAPASSTACITSGFEVSTEIGTPTGTATCTNRQYAAHLFVQGTAGEPGRVDSPPMSRIWAPSLISFSAWRSACGHAVVAATIRKGIGRC